MDNCSLRVSAKNDFAIYLIRPTIQARFPPTSSHTVSAESLPPTQTSDTGVFPDQLSVDVITNHEPHPHASITKSEPYERQWMQLVEDYERYNTRKIQFISLRKCFHSSDNLRKFGQWRQLHDVVVRLTSCHCFAMNTADDIAFD